MNHYILTGAGFSKNFGGWVSSELWAFLIGHQEVQNNEKLKELLWKNKNEGFENVLYEAKENAANDEEWNKNYNILQEAISQAFNEMNESFFLPTQGQGMYDLENFFKKFNVIFTTNQDILIETKFLNLRPNTPGMSGNPNLFSGYICKTIFYPTGDFNIPSTGSIYIKLHGSSNWRTTQNNKELMIVGGKKEEQIQSNPVIKSYFDFFENKLYTSNSRLMILGHSLLDPHINQIICRAIKEHNLRFYIWNSSNLDKLMENFKKCTGDDEIFKKGFLGFSNLPIKEGLQLNVSNSFELEFNRIQKEFFGK